MNFHFFSAFKNSLSGLKLAWKEDASYRRSLLQTIFFILVAIGIYFTDGVDAPGLAVLVVAQLPIVIVELINCAIEAVTDKASPNYSHLAKKAKDVGSAAVLMTRGMALLIWVAVLWHNFVEV